MFDNDKYTFKYSKKVTGSDPDKVYLHQIKTTIGYLEDEVVKKDRLEKRVNMIKKEKDNFVKLLHKYEERFNNKIENAIKTIKKIEDEHLKTSDNDLIVKYRDYINFKGKTYFVAET